MDDDVTESLTRKEGQTQDAKHIHATVPPPRHKVNTIRNHTQYTHHTHEHIHKYKHIHYYMHMSTKIQLSLRKRIHIAKSYLVILLLNPPEVQS